jgi:hypothetical protein
MPNRRRLLATALGLCTFPAGARLAATGTMDQSYAESVAIDALSRDLSKAFGVRLGRFPPKGSGTLWISAYVDGSHYAMADAGLSLAHDGPSLLEAPTCTFRVSGSSEAIFESAQRGSAGMTGSVRARSMVQATEHPDPGLGTIPVSVTAEFRVAHEPVQVRPGRMEVMGSVSAELVIDDVLHTLDAPGKWHEQVGPRPRFAPAFTYLFVQGDGIGIMASRHERGAWGYVLSDGATTALAALDIDPYGTRTRTFTATLADGRKITGTATVERETSVPIEGKRRPGTTVVVESDLGRMIGALNDWNPDG